MQTKNFLDKITGTFAYRDQIVRAENLPAWEAQYGELAEGAAGPESVEGLAEPIQQMLAAQPKRTRGPRTACKGRLLGPSSYR